MSCKKHPADASSGVGICSSCLRERLLAVIAAEAQRYCRRTDADPPLQFPRSVSPYLSRRKSDTRPRGHHQRFYSTPQVGPTGLNAPGFEKERKSKGGRLTSLFSGFLGSISKVRGSVNGPNYDTGAPIGPFCSASSPSPSPSFFPTDFFTARRKKSGSAFSIDESKNGSRPSRICMNRHRGMSPARHSGEEDHGGSRGFSSETSTGWIQTPQRTPDHELRSELRKAAAPGKGASGLKFCLSPLVRASPSRHCRHKGLSIAASFCKNRSRKLADIGKHS